MPGYSRSDHYDGSSFFNPTNPVGNGFRAAMKMLFSMKYEEWPKFVENPPAAFDPQRKWDQGEMGVTFVNHATVLVQSQGYNFLTDPVWSERVSPFTWIGPKRHRDPGIPFDQLPRIDFVLISHNHYDHMDIVTLKKLNEKFHPRFFVPLGNKKFLESHGLSQVVELDWWESFEIAPDARVSLAPAEHFSNRGITDRNKTLWGSYVVAVEGRSLFFAGDTGYSPHFRAIHQRFGAPDIALLPIGAYEPRWFMKVVHMNPEEAVQAHLDLGCHHSVAIHFGTFQLTSESIDQPAKDLDSALKTHNVPSSEFLVLSEGRTQTYTQEKIK